MMDLQKREKYVKTALTVYELQKLVSVRMKECFALLCCKYLSHNLDKQTKEPLFTVGETGRIHLAGLELCSNKIMKTCHLHSFSRQVHVLRASTASAEGTTRTTHAITPVMVTSCNLLHFLMPPKTSDACSTSIICWQRQGS